MQQISSLYNIMWNACPIPTITLHYVPSFTYNKCNGPHEIKLATSIVGYWRNHIYNTDKNFEVQVHMTSFRHLNVKNLQFAIHPAQQCKKLNKPERNYQVLITINIKVLKTKFSIIWCKSETINITHYHPQHEQTPTKFYGYNFTSCLLAF